MIRVTIELISALTNRTSEIGRMYIANNGAGTRDRGDYDVAVCRRGTTEIPQDFMAHIPPGPPAARLGKVTDYPRLAYNVWRLIARACLSTFPEEIKVKPGKSYRTTLTPEVMRGLKILVAVVEDANGIQSLHPDIGAAREWIDASTAEEDPLA